MGQYSARMELVESLQHMLELAYMGRCRACNGYRQRKIGGPA